MRCKVSSVCCMDEGQCAAGMSRDKALKTSGLWAHVGPDGPIHWSRVLCGGTPVSCGGVLFVGVPCVGVPCVGVPWCGGSPVLSKPWELVRLFPVVSGLERDPQTTVKNQGGSVYINKTHCSPFPQTFITTVYIHPKENAVPHYF